MPVPTVRFENNDKAAHAISHYLDEMHPSPQRFALRPFNRFSTEFTEWWFIPNKTEWPAYRYSKLFVHKFQAQPEEARWFYAGFYVEKGLGKKLAGMPDVKQNEIMQDNWYWHNFIRHAKSGEIDNALQEVLTRSQCPVVVSLNVYEFNHVPKPDTERRDPHDWIEFVVHYPNSAFQTARAGTEILRELNTVANLSQLAQRLETLNGLDYFWLNLLIGTRLQYGTFTSGTWGAAEIWHNALEPWNSWVG